MLKLMKRNKIAVKLSMYFAIALLVFSLIIGSVFMILFKNYTIENHKSDLTKRADSIAETLSSFTTGRMGMGGYGSYIKFISDIAGTDVWVIDENHNLITGGMGHGMMSQKVYEYSELPANVESLIDEVFQNKTVYSQDFSGILTEPTLSVGTPIINSSHDVTGAVLLHSPIYGVTASIMQGFRFLLISILFAIIIVFLLAIKFSFFFTKPLNKMKNIALQLADGDFEVVTDIKQHDEIGELAHTLDVLAVRLKHSSEESSKLEQLRKDFVANISHELRTPVTVIRGSLEALVDNIVTNETDVKNYHLQMLSETLFLQRLIGDLLDLSKLQNVDFDIIMENILICDVVNDVLRSAKPIADKKNITLNYVTDINNLVVKGDYTRLRQMIMIVMDNAIKFSKDNSVVDITFDKNELKIQDYGIGIMSSDIANIFTRFYKSRSEQNKTGTGLGLSIAKEISIRHNIVLSATSVYGNGVTFSFKFV